MNFDAKINVKVLYKMKNYPQNWSIILNKILVDQIGKSVKVDCVLVVLVKSLSRYSSCKIPQEIARARIPQP